MNKKKNKSRLTNEQIICQATLAVSAVIYTQIFS